MSDLKVVVDKKDTFASVTVQKGERGEKGDRGEAGPRGPAGLDVRMISDLEALSHMHHNIYKGLDWMCEPDPGLS